MSGDQHSLPRKFKFFRVLLPGFSRKLSIPQKFTSYIIKENSTWATILSPLGKSWNVKISGDGTGMHFEEGWERFAVAHKLGLGDFLVFKYVGGLIFDVTIFDRSTCERDYSVIINGIAGESVPGSEENYEKEFEGHREQTTPPCGKTTAPVEHQSEGSSRGKEGKQQVHMAKETTKVCKRTSCFVVKLSPKHKWYMEVPSNIIRSNDLSSIHQMLLKDPQGGLWPVKLLHKPHASQNRSLLSTGWRDFHVGNSLENGDVCIFELKMKNEMLVQIHRRGNTMTILEDGNTKRPLHGRTTVQLKQSANLQKKLSSSRGTSEPDPYFKSTIFPSNLKRSHFNIPKAFSSSIDLSAEREAILVDPNSRQWLVKILSRKCGKDKRFEFGGGWLQFCYENNLDVGDACIFSFKSQARKATFQVEVFKSEAGAH